MPKALRNTDLLVKESGRPVYKLDGQNVSEISRTLKIGDLWVNVPSIHGNKIYENEDDLYDMLMSNKIQATSIHKSEAEAVKAAKKRSKDLTVQKRNKGGIAMSKKLIKAHQGTVVNGQITYPETSQAPSDPNPLIDTTIPKKQLDMIADPFVPDVSKGEVKLDDGGYKPKSSLVDPAVVSNPFQPPQQMPTMPGLVGALGNYGGAGVDTTKTKVALGGGQLFPTPMPMPKAKKITQEEQTLLDFINQSRAKEQASRNYMYNFDKKFLDTDQGKKLASEAEAAQKEFESTNEFKKFKAFQDQQRKVYNKTRTDAFNNFNNLETKFGFEETKNNFLKQLSPMPFLSVGNTMNFNKGGVAMEEQMELFDEGGMKDDGGEKDPVSGNDIPSGSMAKEVRDDVPAMVSEGEFIFPADVTRFIGLNNLMEMRQDAKMGLKKMEAMGQLGNPEEAELPDDIPFDAADIIIMNDTEEEEETEVEEKAEGGMFGYNEGTAGAESPNEYFDIQKEANKKYAKKYAYYKNDAGDMKTILTDYRGQPLEPVPSGYKLMLNQDGSPVTELPKSVTDDIQATQPMPVEQTQNNERDPEPDPMYSSEYLSDKFKGDVITDKNGNPISMTEQGYNAVLTSAQRLGLSANEYFSLPISARMELAGEEMKALFGGTADTKKASDVLRQVKDGSWKGNSGFLSSLFGGIFDKITGLFSPDGADDETTLKNIDTVNTTNLSNPFDVKKGRKKYERDNTYGTSNIMRTSNDTNRLGGGRGTTSAVRKAQINKRQEALAGSDTPQSMASGKFRQKKDQGDKGIAAATTRNLASTSSNNAFKADKAKRKEKEAREQRAYGGSDSLASGKFGNKGMLISRPSATKKPTPKRKTLIQKKS